MFLKPNVQFFLNKANRAGVTPNEFVITAAAEKLVHSGASFADVFRPGDLPAVREAAMRRLGDAAGGATSGRCRPAARSA